MESILCYCCLCFETKVPLLHQMSLVDCQSLYHQVGGKTLFPYKMIIIMQ